MLWENVRRGDLIIECSPLTVGGIVVNVKNMETCVYFEVLICWVSEKSSDLGKIVPFVAKLSDKVDNTKFVINKI